MGNPLLVLLFYQQDFSSHQWIYSSCKPIPDFKSVYAHISSSLAALVLFFLHPLLCAKSKKAYHRLCRYAKAKTSVHNIVLSVSRNSKCIFIGSFQCHGIASYYCINKLFSSMSAWDFIQYSLEGEMDAKPTQWTLFQDPLLIHRSGNEPGSPLFIYSTGAEFCICT